MFLRTLRTLFGKRSLQAAVLVRNRYRKLPLLGAAVGAATLMAATPVFGDTVVADPYSFKRLGFNQGKKYLTQRIEELKSKLDGRGAQNTFPKMKIGRCGDSDGFFISLSSSGSGIGSFPSMSSLMPNSSNEKKARPSISISKFAILAQLSQMFLGVSDVDSSENNLGGIEVVRESSHLYLVLKKEDPHGALVELWVDITNPMLTNLQITLRSDSGLTQREIDSLLSIYSTLAVSTGNAFQELEEMGVKVYSSGNTNNLSWNDLGGYQLVKDEIENSVLLHLKFPEIFDAVAKKTKKADDVRGSNRIRAVLFEGPPGTGKTSTARIISSISNVPLIYVPLEAILSKWYGESENILGKIFDEANKLGDCIIFVDEIDSIGSSRDTQGMHEVSKRLLSVLLQKIDGFDTSNRRFMLIGATNRKSDLDAALQSRFDFSVLFPLPNFEERKEIFKIHAQQFEKFELKKLSENAEGMTGRDIRDICSLAEREWASHLAKTKSFTNLDEITAPSTDYYLKAINRKKQSKEIDN